MWHIYTYLYTSYMYYYANTLCTLLNAERRLKDEKNKYMLYYVSHQIHHLTPSLGYLDPTLETLSFTEVRCLSRILKGGRLTRLILCICLHKIICNPSYNLKVITVNILVHFLFLCIATQIWKFFCCLFVCFAMTSYILTYWWFNACLERSKDETVTEAAPTWYGAKARYCLRNRRHL